jgi:hypothetical protein
MSPREILSLKPFSKNDGTRDSLALPRFSFESDDHPLVSTDRLFRQWQDEETQYHPNPTDLRPHEMEEQDIIVSTATRFSFQTNKMSRSRGMAHMTRGIL